MRHELRRTPFCKSDRTRSGAQSAQSWHGKQVMDQMLYDSLTPMEQNCLRLAHHERKAEEIAHQLGIKPSTVNSHVFSARKKLGGISRLSAADQLRRFEAMHAGMCAGPVGSNLAEEVWSSPDGSASPHPMSRQSMPMANRAVPTAESPHPAEVREQRSTFVFDDERLSVSGGQDQDPDVALRRLALILAIAALAALVVIAAPAIYDSTAQRIANSLERPHE